MELQGYIKAAQVAESRFPVGGKIASINVKVGQTVKKGALLASLNQSLLQTFLDRALLLYDKERADFDQKEKENLSEFEKRKRQNELDITVKNVEIAKQNLEETNLYSPVDGVVAAIDGGLVGENITPAKFTVTVVDTSSFYFEAEVAQLNLNQVEIRASAKVSLNGFNEPLSATVEMISLLPIRRDVYAVRLKLTSHQQLKPGFAGKAIFG